MVSSYLLLLKTLFSPTLLLLSYHAITIAPKIYCKWTSLSDRTYRTNLGVRKSKHLLTTLILFYHSFTFYGNETASVDQEEFLNIFHHDKKSEDSCHWTVRLCQRCLQSHQEEWSHCCRSLHNP